MPRCVEAAQRNLLLQTSWNFSLFCMEIIFELAFTTGALLRCIAIFPVHFSIAATIFTPCSKCTPFICAEEERRNERKPKTISIFYATHFAGMRMFRRNIPGAFHIHTCARRTSKKANRKHVVSTWFAGIFTQTTVYGCR